MMATAFSAALSSNADEKVGVALSRDGRVLLTAHNGLPEHLQGVYEWESAESFEHRDIVSKVQLLTLGEYPPLRDVYSKNNGYTDVIVVKEKESSTKEDLHILIRGKKAPLMFKHLIRTAVQDLISYAADKGMALSGSSLYITHEPSLEDAILLAGSGVKELVCAKVISNRTTVIYLKESGVEVREQNKTKTDQL